MERLQEWRRIALDGRVVRRALATAACVGTFLTLINHAATLQSGSLDGGVLVQIALTVLVPYAVSTISSVAAIRSQRDGRGAVELLEREIRAINRFPDQNPNPVMRIAEDGTLLYANPSSEDIRRSWGVAMGGILPPATLAAVRAAAAQDPPGTIEVASDRRTFAVHPVRVVDLRVTNLYGTDITANQVVARFPGSNPNPVLRSSDDGRLVYANPASEGIVRSFGLTVGQLLPVGWLERIRRQLDHTDEGPIEVSADGRTYRLTPVPIPEFAFTNIYGTDVTASKAITKFPDQNPNPVLRVSHEDRLLYANPASAAIVEHLATRVGGTLPAEFVGRVRAAAAADSPDVIELRVGDRIYELLVVSVFEFGFINVYGTDVTAAREVRRAQEETERLLLNILPQAIADRLRQGEVVIADRFEEMTVLFADVVGFTELSSQLSPDDVVGVLNRVFSAFDALSERFGLEKIKTIGDAYMVVGGLGSDDRHDHVERVADMGLAMIAAVRELTDARVPGLSIRLGMHVGPTVAGVIGIKKFIYDVWGDTVNMASRMESLGVPDRIQVAETTYQRLRDRFELEARGQVDVKGKGEMPTWLLVGRRAGTGSTIDPDR